jgi:hypothetical protein
MWNIRGHAVFTINHQPDKQAGVMRWRRKRIAPTVTELSRVERVLEAEPAVRRRLGPKTTLVRKRSGEPLYFAAETVAVAAELMARKLSPERAHVGMVVKVASETLGILPKSG